MDTIPYRNSKLLVKTIPKGTLLFRLTKNPQNDTRGVPHEGTRCITPNFNVFFYPNPFVADITLKPWIKDFDDKLYVYILDNDVKVLYLLNPSKYSRSSKSKNGIFIKRCSTVPKGCMPRLGSQYDPCLSDTMIKKYPDVVGMITLALTDNVRLKRSKNKTRKVQKYFHKASDNTGVSGIPEMILHPLRKRPSKDILVHESDTLENNYSLLKTFTRNEEQLRKFMDKHTRYNPDTYFFEHSL
jgi:hypothetical protein